jgi:hypothetical protein
LRKQNHKSQGVELMREESGVTSSVYDLKSAMPLLVLCAALFGCAAPSPPLPPSLELPTPVTDLKAVRKGDSVLLTWTLPQQTTDGEGIRFLGPTRICRSLVAGPEKMTDCGKPAAEPASSQLGTSSAKPAANAPQRVSAHYIDPLPADWMRDPAASVTYAIESLNTSHRSAGLSNQARVPSASTEPPPNDFAAQLTPEGVVLTWTGPLRSIPDGIGAPHYFYRVYRTAKNGPQPTLVGEIRQGTQAQMRLVDSSFVWERTYDYRLNVTTRLTTGPHPCPGNGSVLSDCVDSIDIEGDDAAPATVLAHDIFPPSVPTALQAVFSGAGQKSFIDLTWNTNTDADLAGYDVYRRNGTSQPLRINTELVKAPAFRDANVTSGQTYFYSVAAVDARSNESVRSEETSETVP